MFFTKRCPSGGTEYVSFELFLGILRGPGEGRGGAPGTVPLQNPEITHVLRNADLCQGQARFVPGTLSGSSQGRPTGPKSSLGQCPSTVRPVFPVLVFQLSKQQNRTRNTWETGGILFREYCFGRENSLSSAANSVSSAKNSVSSAKHTNNRLRGTH